MLPSNRFRRCLTLGSLALFSVIPFFARAQANKATDAWIGTWASAPCAEMTGNDQTSSTAVQDQKIREIVHTSLLHDETIREIVHTSLGGQAVRVRFSNTFGKEPLRIGAASIALRATGAALQSASIHELTFSGKSAVFIPAGAFFLSDPVQMTVPESQDLVINLYLPLPTAMTTLHYLGLQTSYVVKGEQTKSTDPGESRKITSWPFLTAVEVLSPVARGAIVMLGSSITDGAQSTPDLNHRWPDYLSARRKSSNGLKGLAILNEGIGGNRVLHDGSGPYAAVFGVSASSRFDRDVLGQAGVRYVVLFEGGNDISQPGSASAPLAETITAQDLITGFTQLAERAHEHGIVVIAGTLTPFAGMTSNVYNAEREAIRAQVNTWIRKTKILDGFIDFDAAVRDPSDPLRLLPTFDSGDHLHPNDAGYKAMADSVDLSLFEKSR